MTAIRARALAAPARFARRLAHLYRGGGAGAVIARIADRFSARGRRYRRAKLAEDQAFDRDGYDTGGIQRTYGLALAGGGGAGGVDAAGHHVAVSPDMFARALAAAGGDPRAFTFVDLGSGKGRAVLLAADRPFRRVIGVEFALELHRVAQANLARRRAREGDDPRLELIHGDAAAFRYPDGGVLLFLFNPFGPPVLTRVIEAARASWRASPRLFRVVYVNPVHLDAWTADDWHVLHAADGVAVLAPEPPAREAARAI